MEPQHIKQILDQPAATPKSLKMILQELAEIELTEEEIDEAIILAKQKKERILEDKAMREREAENRKLLTSTQFTYEQTKALMDHRKTKIFDFEFTLDTEGDLVYQLFCCYFSNDPGFYELWNMLGLKGTPSLDKGILLMGNWGTGKTVLMKLFSRNQRQVFHLHNAKHIAKEYQLNGQDGIIPYLETHINPINDIQAFYHRYAGLCIDDIGTEQEKNNFGNKVNVIGDIIESRYAKQYTGLLLHGTTNLTLDNIKDMYGQRVLSRFYEIFNFVILSGNDRRKNI